MANDIITQLQARNETLTQAIARYGSLNANTLQTLTAEQTKITRITQQLTDSTSRLEENGQRREALLATTQNFAGQLSKLLNVETPDWKLPWEFQDNMVDMAAKGGMNTATRDALGLSLRNWSLNFNQDQQQLQSATADMIGSGITSLQDLSRYMPDIAQAATATRDSAQTWAQAAIATHDKLNVAPADFRAAQNMMYSVAIGGGSSVEEQTQWINTFAGNTGLQGIQGLANLLAAMQIAMKNATSINAAMDDKFNSNAVLSDTKTLDFLAPMLANTDEYRQLKTVATQATGQKVISDDFTTRMASPTEQTKALQLALNDLWLTVGLQLLPAVSELAQSITPLVRQFSTWLRENSALVQGIAKAVGAIWLFNGALNILKLGVNLIAAPFIHLINIFLKVKAALTLGGGVGRMLSLLKSLVKGAKMLATVLGSGLVSGIKLVGQTFIWLGRALLMNPIGLTITAIAGAAYLIYRYWEPISGFFSGIWEHVTTAFSAGLAGITKLILDWSPLGLFHSAFASVVDWFGIDLPASFSEFGGHILNSLINGILNALPFLNGALEKIKSMIPDWAKSAIGISTEESSAAPGIGQIAAPGIDGMLAPPGNTPLTSAGKILAAPKVPATPLTPGARTAAPSGKSSEKPYAMPSRAQSNVQVHFAPQVTVQGSSANAANAIQNVLSLSRRELEKMINDMMAQKQRREYA